jgi:hypothetical protein
MITKSAKECNYLDKEVKKGSPRQAQDPAASASARKTGAAAISPISQANLDFR